MSEISIIAAVADNYAIGKANNLPWHLPADLKHFRQLTTGHAVVMGKEHSKVCPTVLYQTAKYSFDFGDVRRH